MFELFEKFPAVQEYMTEKIKDYDDNLKIFFSRALTSIDYF